MFSFRVLGFFCLSALLIFSSCSTAQQPQQSKKEEQQHEEQVNAFLHKYEEQIGIKIDPEKSLKLYQCIEKWMHTPYSFGSASNKATDCSGFTSGVYRDVYGIRLPRTSEEQYRQSIQVKKKNLQEGTLVFFRLDKDDRISHVGIYLGNNKFVHASTRKGVRIDDLEDAYYKESFAGGGEYR